MWTESKEEKAEPVYDRYSDRLDDSDLRHEGEGVLTPVSEELDYDKELAEAREEKYGYIVLVLVGS